MVKRIRCSRAAGLVVALLLVAPLLACWRSTPTPTASPAPSPTPTTTLVPTVPMPSATSTVTATPTPESTPTPTPDPAKSLRIGWLGAPEVLWPLAEEPGSVDAILSLIFDPLFAHQLDNTFAPALAQNWFSPDNGKSWTVNLQPDVRTHDGQALTAEDVAFTLQLFQGNPRFEYYSGVPAAVEQVEIHGSHSLVITLSRPVANIEAFLHWMPILPKHIWQGLDITTTGETDGSKLIGSGPFVLQEHQPGQYITLRANKAYWRGAPVLDTVTFFTYASGDALADALKAGDLDLITTAPAQRLAELRSESTIQVVSGPRMHVRQLLFNVAEVAHSTGHPALRDDQVRMAIAHAVDKQQLIDVALRGMAMPGLSLLPPVLHSWFNAAIVDVIFDLEESNRILDSAGYLDTDGDGWREMSDGRMLSFRLFIAADSATGSREAEMIGNWLRQIGIQVQPQTLLPEALRAVCCPAFDYDLLLRDEQGGPDPATLLSSLTSAHLGDGRNPTGYTSPTYDALYDQQAAEANQGQRQQIVKQMQELAFQQRPSLVLYYELALQAFRKDRFHNWLFVPNGILSLADVRSLLQVEPGP